MSLLTKLCANRIPVIRTLLVLGLALLAPRPTFAQSAIYKIHLDLRTPLHANVETELDAPDGSLFTAKHAGGYAWWDFIKNVRLIRKDGSTMLVASDAPGHWGLPQSAGRRVRLTYDVDLSFAEKVRNGDLRGGLRLDDSLYVVNRALFVMSSASGPKVIEFAVPASFTIATPWTQIAEYHFRAADNRELTENWTILGAFLSSISSKATFRSHLRFLA